MARVVETLQMEIGQIDIGQIQFDSKSRDDIPRVLRGLQYIYVNRPIREKIFEVLENDIAPHVDKKNGRPGLALWKILVLGVLRLDLNCDYDRLHELANKHETVRQMLGHADFLDKHYYNLQTIKDNVSLLNRVMKREVDKDIAVLMVQETKKMFPNFKSCSFDKGFHSPENQKILKDELDLLSLPRKGKLSQEARSIENSDEYRQARRKHSAVESAINALEVHGLDRCLDDGMDGFKRYVALSIVAKNIQRMGAILKLREEKKRQRSVKQIRMLKKAA